MSSVSEPRHLSNHHRNTLRQLFQHPVSHNIEWDAVLSLLEAVGSAVEQHGGKVSVTIGSETEFFDPPRHKDIDAEQCRLRNCPYRVMSSPSRHQRCDHIFRVTAVCSFPPFARP